MKTIAVYHLKGGVGKTTTAVNLSYLSALQGFRTLIWDLDTQGAASFYFRVKPHIAGGAKKLIRGKQDVEKLIRGTDFNHLDLLPSDFSYRKMDLALRDVKKRRKRIGSLLKPLRKQYDMVFVDCPPGFSLVTENVLRSADVVLMPMIPTTLSLHSLQLVQDRVSAHVSKGARVRCFFTMVDRRKNLHRELCERYANDSLFLKSQIPYASTIEKMGVERLPLHAFDQRSPGAWAYEGLWHEVLSVAFD
jgi:cellulose biosynthesis protein BcsQ